MSTTSLDAAAASPKVLPPWKQSSPSPTQPPASTATGGRAEEIDGEGQQPSRSPDAARALRLSTGTTENTPGGEQRDSSSAFDTPLLESRFVDADGTPTGVRRSQPREASPFFRQEDIRRVTTTPASSPLHPPPSTPSPSATTAASGVRRSATSPTTAMKKATKNTTSSRTATPAGDAASPRPEGMNVTPAATPGNTPSKQQSSRVPYGGTTMKKNGPATPTPAKPRMGATRASDARGATSARRACSDSTNASTAPLSAVRGASAGESCADGARHAHPLPDLSLAEVPEENLWMAAATLDGTMVNKRALMDIRRMSVTDRLTAYQKLWTVRKMLRSSRTEVEERQEEVVWDECFDCTFRPAIDERAKAHRPQFMTKTTTARDPQGVAEQADKNRLAASSSRQPTPRGSMQATPREAEAAADPAPAPQKRHVDVQAFVARHAKPKPRVDAEPKPMAKVVTKPKQDVDDAVQRLHHTQTGRTTYSWRDKQPSHKPWTTSAASHVQLAEKNVFKRLSGGHAGARSEKPSAAREATEGSLEPRPTEATDAATPMATPAKQEPAEPLAASPFAF